MIGRFAPRNFTSFFADRTSFRAKGLRRTLCNSQFYLSFWRSNFISCEKVTPGREKSQFPRSFGDRTSFRAEGLRRTLCNSQFYRSFWRSNLISCERVAFRAVSLALPRAFKREIEKKERAGGQESKRARKHEGKLECEDVRM